MNHLHELLEGQITLMDDAACYMGEGFADFLRSARERATCFFAGEWGDLTKGRILPDVVRFPFPDMWVEFKREGERCTEYIGLLAQEISGVARFLVFLKEPLRKWRLVGTIKSLDLKTGLGEGLPPRESILLDGAVHALRAFCSAINCTNVTREEHKPSEKLQRARAKRGKQPLFSYWTLQLGGPRSSGERTGQGGSHASPRVHLRRGHPRQYAPGKWTWVQPCAVGDRAAGMVHKDYALAAP